MKNLYPHTFNKRTIQRSMERLDRKEKKLNYSSDFKFRLQMKLLKQGKTPNMHFNDLLKKNIITNPRF